MQLLALQFYRLWVFYSAIFCSLNFFDAFVLPPFYLSIIRQLHPVMTLLQVNFVKILASYFGWYYLTKCCSCNMLYLIASPTEEVEKEVITD